MKLSEKTSILILNYKTWDKTIAEVETVINILHCDPKDIIVVDNNSKNDSLKKLSQASKKLGFIFIESSKNIGYAAGNNIGLRYSFSHGYKYCLIMNNDIRFDDPQLLDKLIYVFKNNDKLACVNPDIYSPEGKLYNRDGSRPSFYDMTFGILSYKKHGRMVEGKGGYGIVYRPQGCCMLLDLKKINEVGYLDEHTFLYCEEPILAERLLQSGYECACSFKCSVIHDHSVTVMSSSNFKNYIKIVTKSFDYYLTEYRKFNRLEKMLCKAFNSAKTFIIYKKNIRLLKRRNRASKYD